MADWIIQIENFRLFLIASSVKMTIWLKYNIDEVFVILMYLHGINSGSI